MLPALAFLARIFAHAEMSFVTLDLLAIVHMLFCAAVIVAQATRRAWIYCPFMVYSVGVAASNSNI